MSRRLPPEPCPYLPGTEDKILVMIARVERRQFVFHPLDAVGESDDGDFAYARRHGKGRANRRVRFASQPGICVPRR